MRIPHAARALHAISLAVLLFTVGACAPKPQPKPPEPPPAPVAPPPARPTVTLQASPTFIQQGESTTLSWSSTNATSLTLSGSGVAPEGSTKVSPAESTTYSISASGPGGTADASVRVTVSAPPPPPPPAQPVATIEELFRTSVLDAFFDYNKSDIRPDAREALARTAEFLRGNAQIKVNIEGHCDERGSTEYNLGLGDRRAEAVKQFLVSLGVAVERMNTVSMGKERPFCTESNEACWQQNRRGHFVLAVR